MLLESHFWKQHNESEMRRGHRDGVSPDVYSTGLHAAEQHRAGTDRQRAASSVFYLSSLKSHVIVLTNNNGPVLLPLSSEGAKSGLAFVIM